MPRITQPEHVWEMLDEAQLPGCSLLKMLALQVSVLCALVLLTRNETFGQLHFCSTSNSVNVTRQVRNESTRRNNKCILWGWV